MEVPIKSLLFVCPPVCLFVGQFSVFLRNGSIVFSDFWHDGRQLEYLKTYRAVFFEGN